MPSTPYSIVGSHTKPRCGRESDRRERVTLKKYAWTWKVKPEAVEEYVEMHKNPWPEIMDAHRRAGFHNYSIFRNGNQFFYVFETDDVDAAMKYCDADPDCQRWNAITSKMVEGGFDLGAPAPVEYLDEVFFLE